MSKVGIVRGRRQLADGRRLVLVVCPLCDGRHWLREGAMGSCVRRNGSFHIAGVARG
jgi:hypothetical protein